jgi:hypothetical protein
MTVNDWLPASRKEYLPQVVVYSGFDALLESSSMGASGCRGTIISYGRNPLLSIGSRSGIAAKAKDQL